VGSAVKQACEKLREQVFQWARKVDKSPLAGTELGEVTFAGGRVFFTEDPERGVSLTQAMRHAGVLHLQEEVTSLPSPVQKTYTLATHSAVFVEVKVDEELGVVKVTRVVSAIAGGRIINPKTARSQILGGVVWGIGMALHEETAVDQKLGRFMNHNLAEYHVPVNADVHDIEVIFVDEEDTVVNPLGAKGLGEIGIVGVAAAVANAIFHATGKRVRDLPITIDKLL